ncbi:melatonin receptor type 1B-B-like [Convolutriloba macropyga]|uniref:melatonin receptor type 1B-B-like n=1 Tax=Convolutriloba macropyga TaxID=536237 RepID=UPI003F5236AF
MNYTPTTEASVADDDWAQWARPFMEIDDPNIFLLRTVFFVWVSINAFLGIPGNILVIVSVLTTEKLRQLANIFAVNLAITDLGVMVLSFVVQIGIWYGEDFFHQHPNFCEVSGVLCNLSCYASLWTIMVIAINRYVFIVHNELYGRLFNRTGTVISVILIWVCVMAIDLPNFPFMGSEHLFYLPGLHCGFRLDRPWWYNFLFYGWLLFIGPLCVIAFCYFRIYRLATTGSSLAASEKRRKEQRDLLRTFLILFVAFIVTWFPVSIIFMMASFHLGVQPPIVLFVICEMLAHLNSALNFVVYGFTHRVFRKAYIRILKPCLPFLARFEDEGKEPTSRSQANTSHTGGAGNDK